MWRLRAHHPSRHIGQFPLWLWHRPIGGDGDLDSCAAIETIVTVQRADSVGHAVEWELVRDHVLQRQALALDDAHGGEGEQAPAVGARGLAPAPTRPRG